VPTEKANISRKLTCCPHGCPRTAIPPPCSAPRSPGVFVVGGGVDVVGVGIVGGFAHERKQYRHRAAAAAARRPERQGGRAASGAQKQVHKREHDNDRVVEAGKGASKHVVAPRGADMAGARGTTAMLCECRG